MRVRAPANLIVLCGYVAVSLGYFGRPLLHHPGRILIGTGRDPELFVWAFAWWPHAIGSWTNPFVSHAVYAPAGIDLAWTTSVPGLALAFSPLTILFGPDVSLNVAALLMPALTAWTAYLLCRHLTRSVWASIFGGYLFGFSSYILGHQVGGHLNLTGVFLVPLVALAVIRYLEGELDNRGLAIRLGVLLALQLSISTEVATTLTVFMAFGLVLAYGFLRAERPRLLSSLRPILAGYGLGAIFAAPLVYYTVRGFVPQSFGDPPFFSTDLLNFVIPTQATGVAGEHFAKLTFKFPGNNDERGAYLGLPLLLIVGAYAVRQRRAPKTWFLVVSLLLSALFALGTALRVEGRRIVALPWALSSHVPGLDDALPDRFALFVSLVAAVIAALWIASTKGWIYPRPYLLPLIAVAALVPAVWHPYYYSHPERWAFFTDGSYKCIPPNETLAIFPYGFWGDSMLWQAETGFRFRMAEGYLRYTPPASYLADPTAYKLTYLFANPADRPDPAELLAFAKRMHVDRILSVVSHTYPDGPQMHSFGVLQSTGGMLIAPACGHTSLAGDTRGNG
ncbi:MAG TPA: hypothetical protein VG652_01350 [Gaiellaceae bacterium]|nr:hypothetical protein [Gaiellaceae bacterium]